MERDEEKIQVERKTGGLLEESSRGAIVFCIGKGGECRLLFRVVGFGTKFGSIQKLQMESSSAYGEKKTISCIPRCSFLWDGGRNRRDRREGTRVQSCSFTCNLIYFSIDVIRHQDNATCRKKCLFELKVPER